MPVGGSDFSLVGHGAKLAALRGLYSTTSTSMHANHYWRSSPECRDLSAAATFEGDHLVGRFHAFCRSKRAARVTSEIRPRAYVIFDLRNSHRTKTSACFRRHIAALSACHLPSVYFLNLTSIQLGNCLVWVFAVTAIVSVTLFGPT